MLCLDLDRSKEVNVLPLEPATMNDRLHNAVDSPANATLEHQRDQILRITNYMEALYAQLLVSTNGRPSVAVAGDDRQ